MLERNFRNNLRKEHLGPESRCSDARHPQDGSAAPSEVSIPLSPRTQGTTARLAPLTPRGSGKYKSQGEHLDFCTKVKVSVSSPSCASD